MKLFRGWFQRRTPDPHLHRMHPVDVQHRTRPLLRSAAHEPFGIEPHMDLECKETIVLLRCDCGALIHQIVEGHWTLEQMRGESMRDAITKLVESTRAPAPRPAP